MQGRILLHEFCAPPTFPKPGLIAIIGQEGLFPNKIFLVSENSFAWPYKPRLRRELKRKEEERGLGFEILLKRKRMGTVRYSIQKGSYSAPHFLIVYPISGHSLAHGVRRYGDPPNGAFYRQSRYRSYLRGDV